MSDTKHATTQHPLQRFVMPFVKILGFLSALFLFLVSAYSVGLLIDSAYALGETVYNITLSFGILIMIIMGIIMDLTKKDLLLIQDKKINVIDLLFVTLLICGFVQTFFWVIDIHQLPIHEPRSVFILAAAGILGFFRNQIAKTGNVSASSEIPAERQAQ